VRKIAVTLGRCVLGYPVGTGAPHECAESGLGSVGSRRVGCARDRVH